jgi:hypothetical protein
MASITIVDSFGNAANRLERARTIRRVTVEERCVDRDAFRRRLDSWIATDLTIEHSTRVRPAPPAGQHRKPLASTPLSSDTPATSQ